MTRTLLALMATPAVVSARPCALDGGSAWQSKFRVNAIPMARTTARRLRRHPT